MGWPEDAGWFEDMSLYFKVPMYGALLVGSLTVVADIGVHHEAQLFHQSQTLPDYSVIKVLHHMNARELTSEDVEADYHSIKHHMWQVILAAMVVVSTALVLEFGRKSHVLGEQRGISLSPTDAGSDGGF